MPRRIERRGWVDGAWIGLMVVRVWIGGFETEGIRLLVGE
jgi:hypothetical protein